MQGATDGGAAVKSDDRDDTYHVVVENLTCLVERIHASLELVEQATAVEIPASKDDVGTDVVVLDDVTPGYTRASEALKACEASLGLALLLLRQPMTARIAAENRRR